MQATIKINKTGETMTFANPGAETALEFICNIPADSIPPPKHRHINQTEYFEVLEGTLILQTGDQEHILKPGKSIILPADTEHSYSTPGNEAVKFRSIAFVLDGVSGTLTS